MFDGAHRTARIFLLTEALWPAWSERVLPSLQRMVDASGGRYDLDDALKAMKAGILHVWPIVDGDELLAVMTSEIISYPRYRAFRITGIVGRRPRRWMHLLADVERVAADAFLCCKIECFHQPGHERLLCTPGWRPWHVLSEKRLV